MKTETEERNGTVKGCGQAGGEGSDAMGPRDTTDGGMGVVEATMAAGASGNRRNGNVARLSKEVRDRINVMIEDGVSYREIIERLGEDGRGISVSNLSTWKAGGYQDWLAERAFVERLRARQETPRELVKEFDGTEVNHAALQLGSLHIFEALRELGPGTLNQKLGGDCAAFARLVNALARASRETMLLQKYREACARARAALKDLDPKRKLDESETRAIVRKVDEILGLDLAVGHQSLAVGHQNLAVGYQNLAAGDDPDLALGRADDGTNRTDGTDGGNEGSGGI